MDTTYQIKDKVIKLWKRMREYSQYKMLRKKKKRKRRNHYLNGSSRSTLEREMTA